MARALLMLSMKGLKRALQEPKRHQDSLGVDLTHRKECPTMKWLSLKKGLMLVLLALVVLPLAGCHWGHRGHRHHFSDYYDRR
jgi:hypothetical protein